MHPIEFAYTIDCMYVHLSLWPARSCRCCKPRPPADISAIYSVTESFCREKIFFPVRFLFVLNQCRLRQPESIEDRILLNAFSELKVNKTRREYDVSNTAIKLNTLTLQKLDILDVRQAQSQLTKIDESPWTCNRMM